MPVLLDGLASVKRVNASFFGLSIPSSSRDLGTHKTHIELVHNVQTAELFHGVGSPAAVQGRATLAIDEIIPVDAGGHLAVIRIVSAAHRTPGWCSGTVQRGPFLSGHTFGACGWRSASTRAFTGEWSTHLLTAVAYLHFW